MEAIEAVSENFPRAKLRANQMTRFKSSCSFCQTIVISRKTRQLTHELPLLSNFSLSFVFIYFHNHHRVWKLAKKVSLFRFNAPLGVKSKLNKAGKMRHFLTFSTTVVVVSALSPWNTLHIKSESKLHSFIKPGNALRRCSCEPLLRCWCCEVKHWLRS